MYKTKYFFLVYILLCAGCSTVASVNRFQQGQYYYDRGIYTEAIKKYSEAIESNPNLVEAYNNRGLSYGAINKDDLAIEDFSRAIAINPLYADAYNNRGLAYFRKKEYDSAKEDLNKALSINPKYRGCGAYNNLGLVYFVQQQYDLAIENFSKELELNPTCVAIINRSKAYHRTNQINKAEEDCSRAKKIFRKLDKCY